MAEPIEVRVGGRAVEITSPDKPMFGKGGPRKGELAEYVAAVAETMLVYARDRPLSLKQFPRGITGPGHFIKNAPKHFPDYIPRVEVPHSDGKGTTVHAVATEAAALVYLAGQNTIELHAPTARNDRPDRPDRLITDLDPPEGMPFDTVREAARATGELYRAIGLEPFAMVTGSKGIHVVAPLKRTADWEVLGALGRAINEWMAAEHPDTLTKEFRKEKREGRIYVDWLRNRPAQTAIVPYGVRARKNAPVATPLHWAELDDDDLRADRWTIATAPERAASDPWADSTDAAKPAGAALKAIRKL